MKTQPKQKMPLKKALLWIAFFTIVFSGSATFALLYYLHYQAQRSHDPKYNITAVVQTCIDGPTIPNGYFTELLRLSADRPMNLYKLNAREAERRIMRCSMIQSVTVRKVRPSTLFITYTSRKPIAYLADSNNTMIDAEGHVFPVEPFIGRTKLPKLYIGTDSIHKIKWGAKLDASNVLLGIKLLQLLQEKGAQVHYLDVSLIDAPSSGKQQIIVMLKLENNAKHLLRLTPENYLKEYADYQVLKDYFLAKDDKMSRVVDLRIPQLAYIKEIP